ncbi:MAG: GNAT family N-acetyltransferase [Emergencia sp.]
MENIVLRRAEESDMNEIMEFQVQVFTGEQDIPEDIVLAAGKECLWWVAADEDTIAGILASWVEDGQRHMGRFAVRPAYRGRHIGTALTRYALDDLFAQGEDCFYVEARDATVRIISAFGAKAVGEPFEFYKGTVTPMILCREDYISR